MLARVGWLILICLLAAYLMYTVGLVLVLRRLHKLSWLSFVPILNYYTLIRALGAPGRWFLLSFIPYVGAVYIWTVAVRLGAIFGRKLAFSSFWLTLGAPLGMLVIGVSRRPIRADILDQKLTLLNRRG